MNEQQLLRDPSVNPTSEVIAESLGGANNAYERDFMQIIKGKKD